MLKEKIAGNPSVQKFQGEFYESPILQKINLLYNKIRNKIVNSSFIKKCHINGDSLFCFCFIIYYLLNMLKSTMVYDKIKNPYFDFIPYILITVIYIKLLVFDTDNKRKFLKVMLPAGIIGILVSLASQYGHNSQLLNTYVMLIGAYNVKFRKVALVSVIIGSITMVSVTLMSLFGIIPDLVYGTVNGAARHAFGVGYPTDYAAHWFFILLTYFWYRKGKLRWFENVVFLGIAAFLMYFCKAKLDSGCIVITVIMGILYNNKYGMKIYHKLRHVLKYSVLAAAALSIFVTVIYTPDNWFLNSFPLSIVLRMQLGNMMLFRHGFTFFGQVVTDHGYGGSLTPPKEYNFIDVSYMRILIKSGLFVLLLLIIAFTLFLIKRIKQKDYVTGIVFFLIAINCMVAHHMIDISYNVFLLIILANLKEYDMLSGCNVKNKAVKA